MWIVYNIVTGETAAAEPTRERALVTMANVEMADGQPHWDICQSGELHENMIGRGEG